MKRIRCEASQFDSILRRAMANQNIPVPVRMINCATNKPCAFCGKRTDPSVGPELFMSGS